MIARVAVLAVASWALMNVSISQPARAVPISPISLHDTVGASVAGSPVITVATKAKKPLRRYRRRAIGSSGPVNLTPIRPNAPIGPDLNAPRRAPSMPEPLAATLQPQSPYVAPSGNIYPVPSRGPNETFQDRAVRCQHSAGIYGVPDASRGPYVHNCAM